MKKKRILIVEDDVEMAILLTAAFLREEFDVMSVSDAAQGYLKAVGFQPELIVIDVRLLMVDGFQFCRKLRSNRQTKSARVLMLSDCNNEEAELLSFEMGVDDYLAKPFNVNQLVHRVKILVKRKVTTDSIHRIIHFDGIKVDFDRRAIFLNGDDLRLTATEFNLVWILAEDPGRTYERQELMNRSRGEDANSLVRTIDVHIRSVRRKLGERHALIETVRGVGYRIRPDLVEIQFKSTQISTAAPYLNEDNFGGSQPDWESSSESNDSFEVNQCSA